MDDGPKRFLFIDGLRGLACLAVVLFHFEFWGILNAVVGSRVLSWPEQAVLWHGYLGVEVFFVLSGFVMFHSQRHTEPRVSHFVSFAIRRSLRLDPLYFTAMLLMIAIQWRTSGLPAGRDILINAFYLQGVLGRPSILPPAWTLCYEVQFYLVLVLIVMGARAVGKRFDRDCDSLVLMLSMPLTLASVIVYVTHDESKFGMGPFLDMWFMFHLGMLAYGTVRGIFRRWFWSIVGMLTVVAICLCHDAQAAKILVAVATASLLVIAGRAGTLSTWLKHRTLQLLGGLSYSAYLLHWPIAVGVRSLSLSPWPRLMTASTLLLVLSWACCRFVELPGIALGRRISLAITQQQPA